MKNGDYVIIKNGTLYRFPTSEEMYEWLEDNEDESEECGVGTASNGINKRFS